ncbi:MAG TPA: FAD-dependent oxidoreductase, partial [Flavipsychrobacter sp.]|nr:FAD-dependent oxidoreductase [Flavipsychrobacter sp.]
GAIIKVLLRFEDAFWEGTDVKELKDKPPKELGFIFSQEKIPTWWTQLPVKSSLLTGWLGGPEAMKYKDTSNKDILQISLEALAHIFKTDANKLKQKLIQWHVVNWTAEPFSRGSYTYATVATKEARKVLGSTIADTLFFAGEAFYEGQIMGTVEAALASGLKAAEDIKKNR